MVLYYFGFDAHLVHNPTSFLVTFYVLLQAAFIVSAMREVFLPGEIKNTPLSILGGGGQTGRHDTWLD